MLGRIREAGDEVADDMVLDAVIEADETLSVGWRRTSPSTSVSGVVAGRSARLWWPEPRAGTAARWRRSGR